MGHRSELISASNTFFAKSNLKYPANRGHKRSPPGQEDSIDLSPPHAAPLQKRIDSGLDPS
jgi:hypothetical protein